MFEMKRVSELNEDSLEQIKQTAPLFIDHFSFLKTFREKDSYPSTSPIISECFLFLENKSYIGFSHLEGATDIKSAHCCIYSSSDAKGTKMMIEETTKTALNTFKMLDVIWDSSKNTSLFIEIGVDMDLDISIDNDIIIYTSTNELIKEAKEQLR